MDKPEPWIAECRVRTGSQSQEYTCKAAVWADSGDSLRSRLIAHLSNEDIHLLEVVQALPVFAYFRAHGPDPKLAELSQKVHSGMLAVRGPLVANAPLPVAAGADKPAETLEEALLQLNPEDGPVFAVLDGAQFDDLPKALFDGDFVHRPLYKDNAIGNEDRAKTAPQMVWIDEREERASGRTHKETIPALLELVAGRPAAVFWQCPAGAEALYKHLRSINMVLYPKAAIENWVEPPPPEGEVKTAPETHTMVLFRHADANVLGQILPCMTKVEISRFFGPATSICFLPSDIWTLEQSTFKVIKPDGLPIPASGPLRLATTSIQSIEELRVKSQLTEVYDYVQRHLPKELTAVQGKEFNRRILEAVASARDQGIRDKGALFRWAFMSVITDGAINSDPNVKKFMASEKFPGSIDRKVKQLMDALIYGLRKEAKCH